MHGSGHSRGDAIRFANSGMQSDHNPLGHKEPRLHVTRRFGETPGSSSYTDSG